MGLGVERPTLALWRTKFFSHRLNMGISGSRLSHSRGPMWLIQELDLCTECVAKNNRCSFPVKKEFALRRTEKLTWASTKKNLLSDIFFSRLVGRTSLMNELSRGITLISSQ